MHILFALLSIFFAKAAYSAPACRPFKLHRSADIPALWNGKVSALPEERLVARIGGRERDFPSAYLAWRQEHALPAEERREWLSCLDFYTSRDSDKDGIPDWSALADGMPASVLYPRDEDLDGDGIPNLLDPAPWNPTICGDTAPGEVPAHLRSASKAAALLQEKLFRKFGILAVDHTDEHAPTVLANLIYLLESLPSGTAGKNLRYIFAFTGHDDRYDMAAFHVQAKAISVAGRSAFGEAVRVPDTRILATLAHEIGHAFLFEHTSPAELRLVAEKFGGWRTAFGEKTAPGFYAPVFLLPHPANGRQCCNLISRLAAQNVHEWFAEAFTAAVLLRLGAARLLGADWRRQLRYFPGRKEEYWFDYGSLSRGLAVWFEKKIFTVSAGAQGGRGQSFPPRDIKSHAEPPAVPQIAPISASAAKSS